MGGGGGAGLCLADADLGSVDGFPTEEFARSLPLPDRDNDCVLFSEASFNTAEHTFLLPPSDSPSVTRSDTNTLSSDCLLFRGRGAGVGLFADSLSGAFGTTLGSVLAAAVSSLLCRVELASSLPLSVLGNTGQLEVEFICT